MTLPLRGSRVPVVLTADVRTAVPMDNGVLKQLQKQLTEMMGETVELDLRVEPELVGGMIVKIGDRVIDGSLRRRLRDLKGLLVEIPELNREPAASGLVSEWPGIIQLVTAVPIGDDFIQHLKERLEALLNHPVLLKAIVDPNLIGGMVLKFDDRRIDGSLRTRLTSLKEELERRYLG